MKRQARLAVAGAAVLTAVVLVFALDRESGDTQLSADGGSTAEPTSSQAPAQSSATAAPSLPPDAPGASSEPRPSAASSARATADAPSTPGTTAAPPTTPESTTAPSTDEPAAAQPPSGAVPVPVPAPTQAPDDVGADAADLVLPFVAAASASRATPTADFLYMDVATGAARDDLELEAYEFAEDGMVQTGMPEIVSATVTAVDETADPPQTVVLVCLDYSEVDVRTPDGDSIKAPGAPLRVPSILTLQRIDGRWLVSDRTFPDESTC